MFILLLLFVCYSFAGVSFIPNTIQPKPSSKDYRNQLEQETLSKHNLQMIHLTEKYVMGQRVNSMFEMQTRRLNREMKRAEHEAKLRYKLNQMMKGANPRYAAIREQMLK